MRRAFPGYYRPTEDEFSELWNGCLFAFDANVLLNLYRYSLETSNEFLTILSEISDRLWIPHQAALEYQRRRVDVIAQQAKAYDDALRVLSKIKAQIENQLHGLQRLPSSTVDALLKKVTRFFRATEKELKRCQQEYPDLLEDDHLRNAITDLFDERVGHPYSPEKLEEIYKVGENRYKQKTPPGYANEKKDQGDQGNVRKYGDLILWFQVIDKAREVEKPIILVTDERKEDWWLKSSQEEIIGPRPELIEEMLSEAGVPFYMYRGDPFMEQVQHYLDREVKPEAIDEVRLTRQHDEEYSRLAETYLALDRPRFAGERLDEISRPSRLAQEQWDEIMRRSRLAEERRDEILRRSRLAGEQRDEIMRRSRLAEEQWDEIMRRSRLAEERLGIAGGERRRHTTEESAEIAEDSELEETDESGEPSDASGE